MIRMEMPQALQSALEMECAKIPQQQIIKSAQSISLRYRTRVKNGHFIENFNEAAAYGAARMPATFGAVYSAVNYSVENTGDIHSLIDVGAGTGAASWAAAQLLNLESIQCFEYDDYMKSTGEALMSHDEYMKKARWQKLNIATDPLTQSADLVIASYVMNELDISAQALAAEKLWNAAGKLLLFVEAGTPEGFHTLNRIRCQLTAAGAHIAAPCPHEGLCPAAQGDWCHFTCRIQRTRLHKLSKGGEAPFEDEKYTYLALTKTPAEKPGSRVIRHPLTAKGYVKLELCTPNGLKSATVTKRDGALYKTARKASCGDKVQL